MYINTTEGPIAYRDDAGKHHVQPGEAFEVVGAQHTSAVLAIPGVEPATEAATAEAPNPGGEAMPVTTELEAVPGEALPELPESAYPDDATPLEPGDGTSDEPPGKRARSRGGV